jgi:hypothetical protein
LVENNIYTGTTFLNGFGTVYLSPTALKIKNQGCGSGSMGKEKK